MSKIISEIEIFSKKGARIGLLGGTFDPPHMAHLYMAQSAKERLGLDCIAFMPLGVPPHGKSGISPVHHRLAMLELMLDGYDNFYIDAYETLLDAPSFTVRSIERINALLGEKTKLYFIIGADSLMYLEKWRDACRLMEITDFVVIPRQGYEKSECMEHIRYLENDFNAKITYIDVPAMDHSSTDIRENIECCVKDMTSDAVYKYIKEHDLYGAKNYGG